MMRNILLTEASRGLGAKILLGKHGRVRELHS